MTRSWLFMVLVFACGLAVAYLTHLNASSVIFYFTPDLSFQSSVAVLVISATAVGGLFVMLVGSIREATLVRSRWKIARQNKEETEIETHYHRAMRALAAGQRHDAIALFRKALVSHADHGPSLLHLGNLHQQAGEHEEAIRLYRRACHVDNKNIDAFLALSISLEQVGQREEAIAPLTKILHLEASHLTALKRIRDLYVRLEKWEDADRVQERLLKLDEKDEAHIAFRLGIWYALGERCLKNRRPSNARKYFKAIIKQDKNFLPAHMGRAESRIQEGKRSVAAALLKKGYEMTGQITLLHRLEEIYLSAGTPETIIHIYQEALVKRSEVAGAADTLLLKFSLANIYYRLEMIDNALSLLTEIEVQVEHFPDLYKILGNIHLKRGEVGLAVEAFKKGLALKTRGVIPYRCTFCKDEVGAWAARCGQCGLWNTYQADPLFIVTSEKAPNFPYMAAAEPFL